MSSAPHFLRVARALTIEGSGTALEDEYRRVKAALARCTPGSLRFDGRPYSEGAIEQARRLWRLRMASEHQSSAVFLELALQVIEAGASLDAKAVVVRMAIDELRHAEVCGLALRALGTPASCEIARENLHIADHPGRSAEERALRNVIYGCCLTEMVNTARLVDTLDTMRDPCLREVTRQLLSDEVLHGAFGFHYLEAWSPWLRARPEVRASIGRYLRYAFAVFEQTMSGSGAPSRVLTAEEAALGLVDPERMLATFYQTVEGAILPGLERHGIEATRAYRERSLLADGS